MTGFFRRHRERILPVVVFAVLGVLAVVYRHPLYAWFEGSSLGGGGGMTTSPVGDLRLGLLLDPDPPRQNKNALHVLVQDATSEPVTGAQVTVQYSMAAMGSMPEMKGKADIEEQGGGRYLAAFSLPMKGSWTIGVDVKSSAGDASARYNLTVGTKGLTPVGSGGGKGGAQAKKGKKSTALPLPEQKFDGPILASLRTAYAAYEEVRVRLAQDTLDNVKPRAQRIAESLRAAAATATVKGAPEVKQELGKGADAATRLAAAKDLDEARGAFGEVSRTLVRLAGADDQLAKGQHVFECPMAKGFGFNEWVQPSATLQNPYMGKKMSTCGSEVSPPKPGAEPAEGKSKETADSGKVAYYTCPMHPSVHQPSPGQCPICGMTLTPVSEQEVKEGVIQVDEKRRQLIGVRTGVIEKKDLVRHIRTVGTIAYDQTRLADVSLKFKGWIRTLYADSIGKKVKRGHTLFTIYSPDVYAAEQELLTAQQSGIVALDGGMPDPRKFMEKAIRQRFRLWDVPTSVVDHIIKKRETIRYIPIVSPATGYIVEKNVVEGSSVKPGQRLFRIANLDKVWIEAELYENELPLVKQGQEARITLAYVPDRKFKGKVTFVYPYLDNGTRTGRVRIEMPNRDVELKPDMYANVSIDIDLGEKLVIPDSAVIYAGPRRIVFVDLGGGKLKPQEIKVGVHSDDMYEVLGGLHAGQRVVTSGNFLIGAESRLKSATGQW